MTNERFIELMARHIVRRIDPDELARELVNECETLGELARLKKEAAAMKANMEEDMPRYVQMHMGGRRERRASA